MKRFALLLVLLLTGWSVAPAQEQVLPLPLDSFQLITADGADAKSAVPSPSPGENPSIQVVVSKPGKEFWSVELHKPGLTFAKGKQYRLTFRAKSDVPSFVYFVIEKDGGNQESVAEGTTLQIRPEWTDCTVLFSVVAPADPGRLTISSLSVRPETFWFSDFGLRTVP